MAYAAVSLTRCFKHKSAMQICWTVLVTEVFIIYAVSRPRIIVSNQTMADGMGMELSAMPRDNAWELARRKSIVFELLQTITFQWSHIPIVELPDRNHADLLRQAQAIVLLETARPYVNPMTHGHVQQGVQFATSTKDDFDPLAQKSPQSNTRGKYCRGYGTRLKIRAPQTCSPNGSPHRRTSSCCSLSLRR